MAMIWQKGRRLFTLAAILMLVTAAFHTLGQFGPSAGPAETAVIDAMRAYRIDVGAGMVPSLFDVFRALAFVMTATFVGLGLLNLVLAASPELSAGLRRRVTWVNIVWVTAFSALSWGYKVLPPLISGIVILLFLVASLAANKKG